MKERPILFKAPMVRAILDGTKTQTRRMVKFPVIDRNGTGCEVAGCELNSMLRQELEQHAGSFLCPYGQPGDRLWVKETWRTFERMHDGLDGILYAADDSFIPIQNSRQMADEWVECHDNGKHGANWRPSIFMRRWMSRITLEITDVRVERLQDISQEDAAKEGVNFVNTGDFITPYATLWESINGEGSWDANPWLWVIAFKKL